MSSLEEIHHHLKGLGEMTNSEKNKLIQEFMGWRLEFITQYDLNQWCFVNKHTGKTISGMYNNSELPYCTDWNWLMEALSVFDNIFITADINIFEYGKICDQIDYNVTLYNIYDTVNALCEGIKWYNSTLN